MCACFRTVSLARRVPSQQPQWWVFSRPSCYIGLTEGSNPGLKPDPASPLTPPGAADGFPHMSPVSVLFLKPHKTTLRVFPTYLMEKLYVTVVSLIVLFNEFFLVVLIL